MEKVVFLLFCGIVLERTKNNRTMNKYYHYVLPWEIRFSQIYHHSIRLIKKCYYRMLESQADKANRLLKLLDEIPNNHPDYLKIIKDLRRISSDCPYYLKNKIETTLVNPNLIPDEQKNLLQKNSSSAAYNFFKEQTNVRRGVGSVDVRRR